jgi:arginyl-tRNA synthetase
MSPETKIIGAVEEVVQELFDQKPSAGSVSLQKTRREFDGDFTLVVFPFVKMARQSPEQTARMIGEALMTKVPELAAFNVIKGFLNLSLTQAFWLDYVREESGVVTKDDGEKPGKQERERVVVEFSSPNTNKPLHLGHVRNNLLGFSVARLLEAAGHTVYKVNLVNDRGIHICKSMLAWMKFGKGETPESSGKKGDKLVGDYYVRFESALREEVKHLVEKEGFSEEGARKQAPLMKEAQDLLLKWEQRDPDTLEVWNKMNGWVYEGFDVTYKRLGVDFDKIYHESDTYLLGRQLVMEGLETGVLTRREDGSVWADLTDQNLDEKLLLRSDGTSVYMTQDIGTAQLRYDDFNADKMIYVVGNEQNYHFDVLKKVLKKLDKPYADSIFHLSYGMVELPFGKMKSREGTVVDADELVDEMEQTACRITEELGKTQDFSEEEKKQLYRMIGLGALKYFILKVDPKKNMLFNPEESIDFNGHTGPFVQYTHARICSVLRTAGEERIRHGCPDMDASAINEKEKRLTKTLYEFPEVIQEAAGDMSPARVANYVYELAKDFNQFYHEHSILNEPDRKISDFRICLSNLTARTIKKGMWLLGIEVPERM